MRRGEVADEGKHCTVVSMGSLAKLEIVCVLNCGVTVVKAVRNERKQNTGKELVMHSPILEANSTISIDVTKIQTPTHGSTHQEVAVNHTKSRTKGLL